MYVKPYSEENFKIMVSPPLANVFWATLATSPPKKNPTSYPLPLRVATQKVGSLNLVQDYNYHIR